MAEHAMCADHSSSSRPIGSRTRRAYAVVATFSSIAAVLALSTSAQSLTASELVAQATRPATPDSAQISPQVIDAGRKLYKGRAGCVVCHGSHLEGTAVAPAHKRSAGWKYARDGSIEELARVIVDGIPGTLMVARPNGISVQDASALATYIWSVNHLDAKP